MTCGRADKVDVACFVVWESDWVLEVGPEVLSPREGGWDVGVVGVVFGGGNGLLVVPNVLVVVILLIDSVCEVGCWLLVPVGAVLLPAEEMVLLSWRREAGENDP